MHETEGALFAWMATELEHSTSMGFAAARGALRHLLRDFGLDPATITPHDITDLIREKKFATALRARAIENPDLICNRLLAGLAPPRTEAESEDESPDEIFKRLGWS